MPQHFKALDCEYRIASDHEEPLTEISEEFELDEGKPISFVRFGFQMITMNRCGQAITLALLSLTGIQQLLLIQ